MLYEVITDTALALGEAFSMALGKKKGISRYGFLLPIVITSYSIHYTKLYEPLSIIKAREYPMTL